MQQQKHLLRIKAELLSLGSPQRGQATLLDYSSIIPLMPLTFVKSLWNDGGGGEATGSLPCDAPGTMRGAFVTIS